MSNELPHNPDIECAILFGSHARGDADPSSDRDICIITRTDDFDQLLKIKKDASIQFNTPESDLACFSLHHLKRMADKGSLFLWHLKNEGVVLDSQSNATQVILDNLKPFMGYKRELNLYRRLLADIAQQLPREDRSSELDLHVLQVICRNLSVLLTYQDHQPTFGRNNAFLTAKKIHPHIPITASEYVTLTDWHLVYMRGCDRPQGRILQDDVHSHYPKVLSYLNFCEDAFHDEL